MKNLALNCLFLLLFLTLASLANARTKVIYGEDNRVNVADFNNPLFQKLALSTAGQVDMWELEPYSDGYLQLPNLTLLEDQPVCSEERFANQLAVSKCTGFLVAPDILITAGHCIYDMEDCDYSPWIFDYNQSSMGDKRIIPESSVYYCTKIIERRVDDDDTGSDFAVLKLNKKVLDRKPLKIRRSGRIKDNQKLVVIGSPSGLPTKIAAEAKVFANEDELFFTSNLDTFGGNSGSPVFNLDTGVVEGILVRGEKDYNETDNLCDVVNYCPENMGQEGCTGEEATRISEIIPFLPVKDIGEVNE